MPEAPRRHALVAGVTGLVGARIAEHLHGIGWEVSGVCRRPPQEASPFRIIGADLTDAAQCRENLASLRTVTHVFYAARYDHPEGERESVDVNASMLANLIDAIEPVAQGLQHVNAIHGTKYYGHMLGPLVLPLTEDTPRANVPNFYFAHEDFIRERLKRSRWTYSTARPHTFCDESTDEPRNAALLIAVYASLAKALGEPLRFPGSEAAFHARTQFTHVPMLARAVEWMATTPRCANQSYNVVNGDAPRWSELWPRIAEFFGVAAGGPAGFRLRDYVSDKEPVWQRLVKDRQLDPPSLSERVLWPYAEYLFAPEWDIISATSKARRDGFLETVDSARMFIGLFERFREKQIVP